MSMLKPTINLRIIGFATGIIATIILGSNSYALEKSAVEKKLDATSSEKIVSYVVGWVKNNTDKCSLIWTRKIQAEMNRTIMPKIYLLAQLTDQEKKHEMTETLSKLRIDEALQEAMKKGSITVNQNNGKPLVTFRDC